MKKLLTYLIIFTFVFGNGILYAGQNDHGKGNNHKKNNTYQHKI